IISLFDGTTAYSNVELPAQYIPAVALFPFWDDTYIAQGSPQGIFYTLTGGTDIVFQYYLTRYDATDAYYNYTVSYSTNQPGVFTFTYVSHLRPLHYPYSPSVLRAVRSQA
ncbi:MAG: hypothetical protein L6R42_004312, partial [Xanthoria sp. 1 TBL-2021]